MNGYYKARSVKMKKNYPKVTVVTITYNAEQYLEQTIKSLIEQDYPNIEYIIIDGASSDKTVEIIKKYEEHIAYWASEPDNGIYDAMNKGIDVATGEWINFMNAGDSFCENNTISKVIKEVDEDTDIISGDIYYLEGDKKTYRVAAKLENKLNQMFCCHQAMFAKTHLMKKYKFDTIFKTSADYDFALKCAMNGYKFQFTDFAIANFLYEGASETNRVLTRIEEFFIQSRYVKDKDKIFKLHSFDYLRCCSEPNQNYNFALFINSFYRWIDRLDSSKRYILYGYGNAGKLIYDRFGSSIKAIVDMHYKNLSTKTLPINNPLDINNFEYDYIIVSVLGREEKISKYLIQDLKIQKDKILIFEFDDV